MALPIGLQLYTLRDSLDTDFENVMKQVADIGYIGVEATAKYGGTPQGAKLFRDLGLTVVGVHSPLPLGDKKNEVLETVAILGTKRLICPWLPPERFATADSIKAVCDELNRGDEIARENGLTLLYHNHWFEYQLVDGTPAYKIMVEHLAPTVQLELDTYWIKVGGQDPVQVVKEFGARAPLLHIKDGPAEKIEQDMTAVGDGVMDVPGIINAAQSSAEWLVVELDRCATDMMQAVAKSYQYLIGEGLARGNKG
jgi:sugar phosphate isomerase/epimerase